MTLYVAPIVEGQTEDKCVELLLQRIWHELLVAPVRLQVLRTSRAPRDKLIHATGTDLARRVEDTFVSLRRSVTRDPDGRGLLLLDAETDCPAELAPRLLVTARAARSDADIVCVLAKRMLENWIVGGASTLAGVNDLPDSLPARTQFEDRSGAAWIEAQLRSQNKARAYKKTVDAKVFVQAMSLTECRTNCPSFDKLCRELEARNAPPPAASETSDATPRPSGELQGQPDR